MATTLTDSTRCPAGLDRTDLRRWYLSNRNRSAELFWTLAPEAYYDQPVALRHPLAFYEGHLPAFTHNKLLREALGEAPIDEEFQTIFERGIDPGTPGDAARHSRPAWPERAAVRRFGARVDAAVLRALATADLTNEAASPLLHRGEAAYTILEHESMHHETFAYLLHRLPYERKRSRGRLAVAGESAPAATGTVTIPAGTATLGVARDTIPFGWDNEYGEITTHVPAFEVDVNNVTSGEYLAFVRAGGPVPPFWIEQGGEFLLSTMFEAVPLPASWPVYVSLEHARAYAAWRGRDLMTEAEYHRAAYGTPEGTERPFPWGIEPPDASRGNFDFRRFDPESVGSSPRGASAWGVHDLVGNGWEWTATPFAPFPGFTAMASYPPYSADFFDGKHYVMKGASPVTSRSLIRRSFRNWFYADYRDVFATFRTIVRR